MRLWPVVALCLALPAAAQAHTPIEGIGDFWSGAVHPLTTPSHLLLLLALGLLLGQQKPLKLKWPMLVFGSASALALLLTAVGRDTRVYQPVLLGLACCTAALVALERQPPRPATLTLLAVAAFAIGLDSAVESASTATLVKTLSGTWISLGVLLADIAIYASFYLRKDWMRIGIRVMGSWILAATLLVLAFLLRG